MRVGETERVSERESSFVAVGQSTIYVHIPYQHRACECVELILLFLREQTIEFIYFSCQLNVIVIRLGRTVHE